MCERRRKCFLCSQRRPNTSVPEAFSQAVMSSGSYPAGGMQTVVEKQNLYKFRIKLLNEVLKLRFFNARYMRHSGGEKPSSDLMS